MPSPWMSDQEWDNVMKAIVESKYQLLLGAGVSLEAEGPKGRLPGGWALANEMAGEFSLPGDPQGNLRQVFSMAKSRISTSGQGVLAYLADRFSNCTAPGWYADLVSIPWRYIWSLNIDDAVENAYNRQFADRAAKELVSVSWTDPHRVPSSHQVILVHLHGVALADRTEDLIFDISSYVYATTARHRWHSIFADRYADTPTIILGARLSDEFDLENVLDKGRLHDSDSPSLIVMPEIDDFSKARFRDWGLIPVEASAEEFLALVRQSWPEYFREAYALSEDAGHINPNALAFLSQWHAIGATDDYRFDSLHDFFAGHEPIYSDILRDLDSERTLTKKLVEHVLSPDLQKTIFLSGAAFTGKSTIVLRVAKQLAGLNWKPYLLDPELRPDSSAALWWLRQNPRTLLIVEGAADFAPDLAKMVVSAKERGIPLSLLAVERRSRAIEVRRSFANSVLVDVSVLDQLHGQEIDALIAKLQEHRRLGVLTDAKPRKRIQYFNDIHQRDLFSALSNLEEADGFRNRMNVAYSRLKNDRERATFQAVSITSSLGYGLPFGAAVAVSGLQASELNSSLESASLLGDLVRVAGGRLYPRHRAFGSYMVEHAFRAEEIYDITLKLAKHFGPQVSRAAISGRSFAYRLVRQLLDHEILAAWMGEARLDRWYEELQTPFSWNARYWEQRALAASKRGRHAPATSWARQAIVQHRDAFALNTLATVLFRKCLDDGDPENGNFDTFLDACAQLEEARASAEADSEYPYITFFNYALEWAVRYKRSTGSLDRRIIRKWNDWVHFVEGSPVGKSPELRRTLAPLTKKWLSLASDDSSA